VTTLDRTAAPTGPRPARPSGGWVRLHVLGAIFKRDFFGYFSSPAGYVFITLFVLACSWVAFGLDEFFARNLANLDTLNTWMPYLLLFFVPAITMSVWAEERRQGTEELLLTLPARDVEVVLGKFLAALGIYTVALAFTLSPIVLLFLGSPDPGVMLATYFGYWLMGAMLIAVGLVASILATNVTVAFILGGLFCAVPVFAALVGSALKGLPGIGQDLGEALETLSVPAQFRDFGSGVVPLSGVMYFVALTVAMLYVNMVLLGRRHWAGGTRSSGLWLHYLARAVCLVVALASLAVMTGKLGARPDISAEGLNTLSGTSINLIRQVPANRPIYIQAFYSPKVPREYVETKTDFLNILREIQARGGDRIRLNLVPTERYSEAAREAEKKFGITPRRVFTAAEGQQGSDEIFLGVAFTSGPEEVVVPFVDRGLPVEYELVRSLRVVSGSKRKKVGILQTDARLLGGFDFRAMNQNTEWEVVTELKKQYEVTSIPADEPISADLDALIVAQASSMTQPQIENLTAFVRGGGPTLLLLDPLPFVDPSLAPSEPRTPPGGMFGGQPPPEPKGDLGPLLDLLGVIWPSDEIVWNRYNPHPVLSDAPPEYLFIGRGSGAADSFGNDPASESLQKVVLLFGGLLRPRGGTVDFQPLLRTNELGGTLTYAETVQRGFMGMMNLNRSRPYRPSGQAYTVAARVKGPAPAAVEDGPPPLDPAAKKPEAKPSGKPLHAVVIADLDLISDTFFQLRRDRPQTYEFLNFDNVTFVLNCVDTLVGDDSFLDLRTRRSRHRTLEVVEAQSRRFIKANQDEDTKADEAAREELTKAQGALDKKVAEVRARKDLDERTQQIMLDSLQDVENRRFEVTKATIDARKERTKELNRANREQAVRTIHTRIRALAILLPPLPPLLLGLAVFAARARRENRGANPNRIA
jgi:ABC-2 type transport system permease protein